MELSGDDIHIFIFDEAARLSRQYLSKREGAASAEEFLRAVYAVYTNWTFKVALRGGYAELEKFGAQFPDNPMINSFEKYSFALIDQPLSPKSKYKNDLSPLFDGILEEAAGLYNNVIIYVANPPEHKSHAKLKLYAHKFRVELENFEALLAAPIYLHDVSRERWRILGDFVEAAICAADYLRAIVPLLDEFDI